MLKPMGVFLACTFLVAPAGAAPPAPVTDFDAYVSTVLPAAERDFMRAAIGLLPDDTKADILAADPGKVGIAIVEGATGTVHYNRPGAKGSVQVLPARAMPGDDAPNEIGCNNVVAPNDPGCFGGSGPYRRVYTTPVTASPLWQTTQTGLVPAWRNAYGNGGTVTVDCKAGHFNKHRKTPERDPLKYLLWDVGFSYLGGWSPTPSATGGSVDAGLQYTYEATAVSHDNYAMFIAISNVAYVVGNPAGFGGGPARIDCDNDTPVDLKFTVAPFHGGDVSSEVITPSCQSTGSHTSEHPGNKVATCEVYQFTLTEQPHGTDALQILAWLSANATDGGWGTIKQYQGPNAGPHGETETLNYSQTPCGGCVFKWMTSIGQKIPHQDLTDKSRYGATWSDRTISSWALSDATEPGSREPLTTAIVQCSEYPVWNPPYGKPYNKDCRNSPKGLKGISDSVKVTGYSVTGETDKIDLDH